MAYYVALLLVVAWSKRRSSIIGIWGLCRSHILLSGHGDMSRCVRGKCNQLSHGCIMSVGWFNPHLPGNRINNIIIYTARYDVHVIYQLRLNIYLLLFAYAFLHAQLCADGTCADNTAGQTCDPEAISPCSCNDLPFACAKQVDLLPECISRFQTYSDANTQCLELQTESLPQVKFTGPWFMACYIGLSTVTFLMLSWCAYNQRWARVKGSTVPLESPLSPARQKDDNDESEESIHKHQEWSQTGYKPTIVGMTIYALIILTHWIFQFLLFALVVEYCEYPVRVQFCIILYWHRLPSILRARC